MKKLHAIYFIHKLQEDILHLKIIINFLFFFFFFFFDNARNNILHITHIIATIYYFNSRVLLDLQ